MQAAGGCHVSQAAIAIGRWKDIGAETCGERPIASITQFMGHCVETYPLLVEHIEAQDRTLLAETAALAYAIRIIRSYESDMRNTHARMFGVSLAEAGVCQGVVYREAVSTIQGLSCGSLKPGEPMDPFLAGGKDHE